jgi:cation-transporting ATPase 13A1
MLCVNGDILDQLFSFEEVAHIIELIDIFSRTSPNQKDFIVSHLNKVGNITMMCGDGTNDVGSLKRANVGLAVVNNKEPTKEDKSKRKTMSMWLKPGELAGLTPQ